MLGVKPTILGPGDLIHLNINDSNYMVINKENRLYLDRILKNGLQMEGFCNG